MLRFSFLTSLFLLLGIFASAQADYLTLDDLSGKAKRAFERAQGFIERRDLPRAERALSEVLEEEPTMIRARILLGHVRYESGNRSGAIEHYQRALELAPQYDQRLWYQYAETLRQERLFAEAAVAYRQFLETDEKNDVLRKRAEQQLANVAFAAEALANPQPFDPEPLPSGINTPQAEYLPSFTADQSLLVYTAVRQGQEDFYQSRYIDSTWTAGEPIASLNTSRNEGAQTISADGRVMVFTACNRPESQGGCDLYIAYRTDSVWGTPKNMGPTINTRFWDSQPSLSANGRLLYFASNRPGGKGKNDIWITYRQTNGTWIRPVNAGAPINTERSEQSPFIHSDGRTLYFMSDGHPGLGGFDLFLARLQADGTWNEPRNLGYPINTFSNEGALTVQRDGRYAYFSKDVRDRPEGEPLTDIYRFELPENIRPAPVTYVQAQVRDARTLEPLTATALLTPTGEELAYYDDSTDINGQFLICLPVGKDYALTVERAGYLFYSDYFGLSEAATLQKPFQLEVLLQPIEAPGDTAIDESAPVVLRNVFFATGSAELLPASENELHRLYRLLEDRPALRIRINGHTDNVGSDADNQALSEARAKAVYDYLLDQGIKRERLTYKGFGEEVPIATNDTPEGRQRNRRTEFEVLPLN